MKNRRQQGNRRGKASTQSRKRNRARREEEQQADTDNAKQTIKKRRLPGAPPELFGAGCGKFQRTSRRQPTPPAWRPLDKGFSAARAKLAGRWSGVKRSRWARKSLSPSVFPAAFFFERIASRLRCTVGAVKRLALEKERTRSGVGDWRQKDSTTKKDRQAATAEAEKNQVERQLKHRSRQRARNTARKKAGELP